MRPIKGFAPLLHAPPLKEDINEGSDIYIIRELTGGLYFGTPRERRNNGNTVVDTLLYERNEIERIVEKGFESAQMRRKHLVSVDNANLLKASLTWRESVVENKVQYTYLKDDHIL